jgi:chromosome segregation ATPase
MLLGGGIYALQASVKLDVLTVAIKNLTEATDKQIMALQVSTAAQIKQANDANGERANALSARLTAYEEGLRDVVMQATKTQGEVVALRDRIDAAGKRRDEQVDDLRKQLADVTSKLNAGEIRDARIESQLDRVLDVLASTPQRQPPR